MEALTWGSPTFLGLRAGVALFDLLFAVAGIHADSRDVLAALRLLSRPRAQRLRR